MKATVLILTNHDKQLLDWRRELIEALLAGGYRPVAALPAGPYVQAIEALGCRCFRTPIDRRGKNPLKDFLLFMRYFRLLVRLKPAAVVCYSMKPWIYGGIACRLMQIPCVANITGIGQLHKGKGFFFQFLLLLNRLSLKKSAALIFENKENYADFRRWGILKKQRAVVNCGAGVDTMKFAYTPLPTGLQCRFLFMGRLFAEKGVWELIRAARRIRQGFPNARFDLIGTCEENFEPIIRSSEKTGTVHFYGPQDDVRPFIARSHCVVLPSYHEGMSNALLEAGAMGRPLIASNIAGCREAIVDGVTGFLCRPRDADDLYEKLRCFLLLSESERRAMGLKSREHIAGTFNRGIATSRVYEEIRRAEGGN